MSDLRSKLIRLAHQNPELRSELLPLLEKTAKKDSSKPSKTATRDILLPESALEEINLALRQYDIPLVWTDLSKAEKVLPVPKSLSSLFTDLSVILEWDRNPDGASYCGMSYHMSFVNGDGECGYGGYKKICELAIDPEEDLWRIL